ncbi:unnamed protein product [Bemisia tabaci]|uniref:Cuticle protein n=1 Tax=Bemisia tabaci TaxID=7038 RepID=A0A9P0A603_BEMTA|nr:unnamed protein product [Bemisia tabaci]
MTTSSGLKSLFFLTLASVVPTSNKMAFKLCIVAALVAIVNCQYGAPAYKSAYAAPAYVASSYAAPAYKPAYAAAPAVASAYVSKPVAAAYAAPVYAAPAYAAPAYAAPAYAAPVYSATAYKAPSYGYAPSYPDAHPAYKFAYNVQDPHTYDVKSQEESRDGDNVQGVYTVNEADGSKRVVHYADNGHGFEAVVSKEGGAPAYAAPAYAAPAYAAPKYAAPAYPVAPAYKK